MANKVIKYAPMQVRSPCSKGHSVILSPNQDLIVSFKGITWTLDVTNLQYGFLDKHYVDHNNNSIFEFKQFYDLTDYVKNCVLFLGRLDFVNHSKTEFTKSASIYVYLNNSAGKYATSSGKVVVLNPSQQNVRIGLNQVVETVVTFDSFQKNSNFGLEPKWSISPNANDNYSKYIKILRSELHLFDVPESYDALKINNGHSTYKSLNWNNNKFRINPNLGADSLFLVKENPKNPTAQFHLWFYIDYDIKNVITQKPDVIKIGSINIMYGDNIWSLSPCIASRSLNELKVDRTDLEKEGKRLVFNSTQKIRLNNVSFNPSPNESLAIQKNSEGHIIELPAAEYTLQDKNVRWEIEKNRLESNNNNLNIVQLNSRKINSVFIDRFYVSARLENSSEDKVYLGFFSIKATSTGFCCISKFCSMWLTNEKIEPEEIADVPKCNKLSGYRNKKKSKNKYKEFYRNDYSSTKYQIIPPSHKKKIKKIRFVEQYEFEFGLNSWVPIVLIDKDLKKNSTIIPLGTLVKTNLNLNPPKIETRIIETKNIKNDMDNSIKIIEDLKHGDAIVVEPEDKVRIKLAIPEHESQWVLNPIIFGSTKNMIVEQVIPVIPGTNLQYFDIGFYWKEFNVDKYGHHLVGAIKFSNQSSYFIAIFYINVTQEHVRKGEFGTRNPEYIALLREISKLTVEIKNKKTLNEKIDQTNKTLSEKTLIDPDLSLVTNYIKVVDGDIFTIGITKKENCTYSYERNPDIQNVVLIDVFFVDNISYYRFQIDNSKGYKEELYTLIKIQEINRTFSGVLQPYLKKEYGVKLLISK